VLYSLETRRFERLTDRGSKPIWLRDGRRLVYSPDPEHLALLDRNTKQSRTVWTAPRGTQIGDFTISKDDTWLCVIQSNDEGDIWLANLQ
jgi:hypothetical protein